MPIVSRLIEGGADINQATSDTGETPLFIASYCGHFPIVSRLLSGSGVTLTRAHVNQATSDTGDTPLHAACQEGHDLVVDALVNCGANVDAVNRIGRTPMQLARERGKDKCVEVIQASIDRAARL